MFTIEVSGQAGTGSASFDYDVKKLSPIAGLITLAALLAFLTILGLSIRAFIKDRTKGHRARRQQGVVNEAEDAHQSALAHAADTRSGGKSC